MTAHSPLSVASDRDPFDTLLTLEDSLYSSAYDLGARDGAHAGRIEGRIFGLEKGFEKFAALGSLHGRACVWGGRLQSPKAGSEERLQKGQGSRNGHGDERAALPKFKGNARLQKHITTLHALTDPQTFSAQNTEEDVADFDDRFKRAGAKAKIIERSINETSSDAAVTNSLKAGSSPRTVRIADEAADTARAKNRDDSIEDFAGSKLLR